MNSTTILPTTDLVRSLRDLTAERKVLVLVDANTKIHCLPLLSDLNFDATLELPAGESSKSHHQLDRIYSSLLKYAFTRSDMIVNLGGGMITDIGGFAAATYMRGIPFVNIPTSLLAMVDAAHGGKVGINYQGVKNYIGSFAEAQSCLIAPEFLQTVPEQELRCGYAEMIKHAILRGGSLYEQLRTTDASRWKDNITADSIRDSFQFKISIVKDDFQESGLRKILNFGHTIGHAVESVMHASSQPINHGEAVAIGMCCASMLSEKYTGLDPEIGANIRTYVYELFGRRAMSNGEIREIARMSRTDKKNAEDSLRMVLLEDIGKPVYDISVPESDILTVLTQYQDRL